ncbi:MAG: hypothetical protein M1597_01820 [Candidatus Thermoplasmatota archaeon]|nr:hypothetical protein [Candidatus Thermoplasmatota archaeon]
MSSGGIIIKASDTYTIINDSESPFKTVDIPIENIRTDLVITSSDGRKLSFLRNEEIGKEILESSSTGLIRVVLPEGSPISVGKREDITLIYSASQKFRPLNSLSTLALYRILLLAFDFYPWIAKTSIFSISSDEEPRVGGISSLSFLKSFQSKGAKLHGKEGEGNFTLVWENAIEPEKELDSIFGSMPLLVSIKPDPIDVAVNCAVGYTLLLWGIIGPIMIYLSFINGILTVTGAIEGLFGLALFILTYSLISKSDALIIRKPVILVAATMLLFVSGLLFLNLFQYLIFFR